MFVLNRHVVNLNNVFWGINGCEKESFLYTIIFGVRTKWLNFLVYCIFVIFLMAAKRIKNNTEKLSLQKTQTIDDLKWSERLNEKFESIIDYP